MRPHAGLAEPIGGADTSSSDAAAEGDDIEGQPDNEAAAPDEGAPGEPAGTDAAARRTPPRAAVPGAAHRVPPPAVPGRGGEQAAGEWRAMRPETATPPVATPPPVPPGAGAATVPPAAPPLGPPGRELRAPARPFDLPAASWTWAFAVAGLIVGTAPEAALYLAALAVGTTGESASKVTTGSAAALAAGSLVLYGWQVLAAWLFSLRVAGRKLALWGFRRPTRAFFWTIPLALAAVYAVSVVHDLVVHPEQQDIISEFPRSEMGVGLFILVAVIMAPLFEEIVFRGFLFRGFANSWGWIWGAVASACVFGLAHLQFDVFIPLAALGFALAWVYKRTGSLWTSITMHALFNGIAVLAWAFTG